MPEVSNVSNPGEEWKNKVQEYAIELTNIRYRIDMGEHNLIREYKAMLNAGVRNFSSWLTEDEEKKVEVFQDKTNKITGISQTVNTFTGNSSISITPQYHEMLNCLDSIERLLRGVMKRENFLVKVAEKKMRLS